MHQRVWHISERQFNYGSGILTSRMSFTCHLKHSRWNTGPCFSDPNTRLGTPTLSLEAGLKQKSVIWIWSNLFGHLSVCNNDKEIKQLYIINNVIVFNPIWATWKKYGLNILLRNELTFHQIRYKLKSSFGKLRYHAAFLVLNITFWASTIWVFQSSQLRFLSTLFGLLRLFGCLFWTLLFGLHFGHFDFVQLCVFPVVHPLLNLDLQTPLLFNEEIFGLPSWCTILENWFVLFTRRDYLSTCLAQAFLLNIGHRKNENSRAKNSISCRHFSLFEKNSKKTLGFTNLKLNFFTVYNFYGVLLPWNTKFLGCWNFLKNWIKNVWGKA